MSENQPETPSKKPPKTEWEKVGKVLAAIAVVLAVAVAKFGGDVIRFGEDVTPKSLKSPQPPSRLDPPRDTPRLNPLKPNEFSRRLSPEAREAYRLARSEARDAPPRRCFLRKPVGIAANLQAVG